ncbi:MAG: phage tail tube protein [Pseudomonadota bacterium]
MTTLALPRGKQAGSLLLKDEAVYGTAPASGDYTPLPFYTENLGSSEPLEDDPVIGADEHNTRDSTKAAPGLISHGGDVVFPMCLNNLGEVMRYAFGAPTTVGAGADKTHTFNSGATSLPSAAIQVPKKSDAVMVHKGCVLSTLGFDFSRSGGYRRVNTSWLGRIDSPEAAALGAEGTPLGLLQIPGTLGTLSVNGATPAHVMSGQLTFNSGASPLEAITGDRAVSAAILDNPASCEGQFVVRFTDTALYDEVVAENEVPIVITFELSATQSIAFSMPACRLGRQPFAPISGPGGMEVTMPFRAAQTADDPMLSVVLKNQIESY